MATRLQPANRYRSAKILTACCGAHVVQDGLIALQYVLLPVLAQAFGLNYAQVGLLRGICNTMMTVLEVPAGVWAERTGERRLLVAGLVGAGFGYFAVAVSDGFFSVALAFLLVGAGAGFQHSLASAVVVRCFDGASRRRALGTYNAAGDAGKLTFTALFSVGVGAGIAWNTVVTVLALAAIGFGAAAWMLLHGGDAPRADRHQQRERADQLEQPASTRWGVKSPARFRALGTIVFLDSTVQSVFLTFIAFVLLDKGASQAMASAAVVLALTGGMIGKFCCGFVAARYGDRGTFVLIQVLTVAGLVGTVLLPAIVLLVVLPIVGLVVQGSSTVTYGSVADFVDEGRQSRGYALIYTLASASSVAGPFLFGLLADGISLSAAIWVLAGVAALTIPLSYVLARSLHPAAATMPHR